MEKQEFYKYLLGFRLTENHTFTQESEFKTDAFAIPIFTNEFWTSQQRQANAIHEVSYRACFKPQLPRFFIELFTQPGNLVYDPFNGRGTTVIEAALLNRNVVANDVNPLSLILTEPRIEFPLLATVENRLNEISFDHKNTSETDLSMFYHQHTLSEIISIKNYLIERRSSRKEDVIDRWIRMVATNRLTGHSKGFFSVYTLPPNQAVSAKRQIKINADRMQMPEYRDVRKIILKKSGVLLRDVKDNPFFKINHLFLNCDAANTPNIKANTVSLTVTSPPFLDVVQYATDNWLRCWFNNIDLDMVSKKITMSKTVNDWSRKMQTVFNELYRITQKNGIVAFEVGDVKKGKVKLDEIVVPLGLQAGFSCDAILINQQNFTKTANIWGVGNNNKGTNTNKIVVFRK